MINSNTIIYCIVMNKSAGLENLAKEFAKLPGVLASAEKEDGRNVVLVRTVEGLSRTSLENGFRSSGLEEWQIFDGNEADWLDRGGDTVLPAAALLHILARELLRITRNGSCLSLISAQLAEDEEIGAEARGRLHAFLGHVLKSHLASCDSFGILKKGQYICCLPGIGQLAARNFAETAQRDFNNWIELKDSQNPALANVGCAMGIVNLTQGDKSDARELLNRSRQALEVALAKPGSHIHQETAGNPLENTTLVQSSEKRFLFFGGEAS